MNNKLKIIINYTTLTSGLSVYTCENITDKFISTAQLAALLGYKSHNDMSRQYVTFYGIKSNKNKYKLIRTDDVFKILEKCRNTTMANKIKQELIIFLHNAKEIIPAPIKEKDWKDSFLDKVKEILSRNYYNKSTYITCLENLIKHSKKN